MKAVARFCELCDAQAALYCPSDSAFLCWSCDAKVHQANFLVARHVRRIICSKCKGFTENPVSALCFPQSASICSSCSPASSDKDHLDSLSSSSNSDCVSSTMSCATSQKKTDSDRPKISRFDCSNSLNDPSAAGGVEVTSSQRRSRRGTSIMDLKAEGILVYWCGKLGLPGDRALRLGRSALSVCWKKMSFLPFRVSLADLDQPHSTFGRIHRNPWLRFRFSHPTPSLAPRQQRTFEKRIGFQNLISLSSSLLFSLPSSSSLLLFFHHFNCSCINPPNCSYPPFPPLSAIVPPVSPEKMKYKP